jgi:hypothetical protein
MSVSDRGKGADIIFMTMVDDLEDFTARGVHMVEMLRCHKAPAVECFSNRPTKCLK